MSTSDRTVLAEAAGVAALVVGIIAVASPHDVWLQDFGLHPMWIPVIVMSARYATRGLLPSLTLIAGGLVVTSLALDDSLGGFTARTRNPSDLIALTTAVLVAWVATAHESRMARAVRKLGEASESQHQAEEHVHALHSSLGYLRSRHDRLDVSLSLWRSLAFRLERGGAAEAARAVLELCEIRAGAHAGTVQLRDGARLTTLASRGQWSPTMARPVDVESDATIAAAIRTRLVTPAGPGSSENDADLAVPVIDEASGAVLGVIALRGVSPRAMKAAELRDLGVLAQWLAPSAARELRRKFGKALIQISTTRSKNQVTI